MTDHEHPVADLRDPDGYAPIDAYGVLGDGRGTALVALDGSVDWWAVPRLDSPPAFAALLDPDRGGHFALRPADRDATVVRRYRPHTNQLETTYTTSTGRAQVVDSLNSGSAGALPWSELARRVDGLEGEVEFELRVHPGDGMRAWEPWTEKTDDGPVLHAGELSMGLRCSDGVRLRVGHDGVTGRLRVTARQRCVLGIVAVAAGPVYLADVASIDHRIDVTGASWRTWCSQLSWPGPGQERIVRSALALKTLTMERTGATAAAATTSLPESVGGPKNWDYRFAWIRDAALTVEALALLGLQEEVHAAVGWLLHAIRHNGPDVHVMYTLDGEVPDSMDKPPVPGYQHSTPVQIGNQAAGQMQLGVYGDLFGTVAGWVSRGHLLDVASSRELADLADRCADIWRRDDAGIWELTTPRQYTISKINCWRALDAARRLAEDGHLSGDGRRWKAEAAKVRAWVEEHCWSEQKRSYTFYAGTEDLDASVLLGASLGFDTGARMSSTIDAIGEELGVGPLLYRYTGAHREEETFLACAYWRVNALACVGRFEEAERLLHELDPVASPLGLMSEMCAPGTGQLVGNLPQALSHLAFIKASDAVRHGTAAAKSA